MLLKRYVLGALGQMFFPFFFILFFISSIILLLNIAVLTSGIKLTMSDLAQLYLYGIPGNLFFVIAITFYAACVLALSRLSYDSEMLVFFSLGISPGQIIKLLLPLCLMVTAVLLLFSLIMVPLTKSTYKDFISYKRNTIDINIKPGDFGQKIGDWLIYVDDKIESKYEGLVLYSKNVTDSTSSFIVAKEGEINNKNGILELLLKKGEAHLGSGDSLQKIHFDEMVVRSPLNSSLLVSYSIYQYWLPAFQGSHSRLRALAQALSISLFPIASIFFMVFFGVKNPRFQRNFSYLYALGSSSLYLLTMYVLSTQLALACLALPVVWLLAGRFLYDRFVKRYY